MKYKKSGYNLFVPYIDEKYIVFNTYSNSIGIFDSDAMRKYEENSFDNSEMKILIDKGIYVPSFTNELAEINKDRIRGIFLNRKTFRIWTTSGCNATCYYCFEKGILAQKMTRDIADATFEFIKSVIGESRNISVEWFGGEPLLNVEIIDYLSEKIQQYCQKRNIKFKAFMISNGSLFTEDIIEKCVKNWKVKKVQITLDGYKQDYEHIKNYNQPEKYNFDLVIKNIKKLSENGIRVSIRMNYDTTNYESLKELIQYLHTMFEYDKNISYYIYPIWSATKNTFVSKSKADIKFLELFEILVANKMATIKDLSKLKYRRYQCSACGIDNYSVLPDGKLLKCSEAFESVIGDVYEGVKNEILASNWTDIGMDDDCMECVFLPLCQGGCRSSKVTKMPRCYVYKDIVSEILKWNIKHLEKKKYNK